MKLQLVNTSGHDGSHWVLVIDRQDFDTFKKVYTQLIDTDFYGFWENAQSMDIRHALLFRKTILPKIFTVKYDDDLHNTEGMLYDDACIKLNVIKYEHFERIEKLLLTGSVRIGINGGFGPYEHTACTYTILQEIECTIKELFLYLYTYKYHSTEIRQLKINSECLFLENDMNMTKELSAAFNRVSKNKQSISNFIIITNIYSEQELYDLFQDGLNNGLEFICTHTSGYMFEQFKMMSKMLITLMTNNPTKSLAVRIITSNDIQIPETPKNLHVAITKIVER